MPDPMPRTLLGMGSGAQDYLGVFKACVCLACLPLFLSEADGGEIVAKTNRASGSHTVNEIQSNSVLKYLHGLVGSPGQ
jgi:hypothetical protein